MFYALLDLYLGPLYHVKGTPNIIMIGMKRDTILAAISLELTLSSAASLMANPTATLISILMESPRGLSARL